LAEAIRAKGQFQTRMQAAEQELARLRAQTSRDAKAIQELAADRRLLAIKLRDRDDELRAKNKLVVDVQDENQILLMEIDQKDKTCKKLASENKQLVERWMLRIGQEAEAMNLANEPHFSKKR